MKRILPFFAFLLLAAGVLAEDTRCYELRIYTAAEGKLEALNARFRDHTCKLFEKHGLTNVGYWVPVDQSDNRLIYVISSPSREAHKKSWQAFLNNPDWKKAYKASTQDGALVAKVDSIFMSATDYSPFVKPVITKKIRTFELRTYTTAPERLKNLHARFRDHTCKIFENHDMTNVAYWTPMDANQGKSNTLIYIISHFGNTDQAKKNWSGFGGDPAWKKARAASEADGKILSRRPERIYLNATDFSPIK
ncbi:MAG: NIPSNAP family protein [Verrucomicrobia subdivision 3 bacterium]|nr:NIPSNAP family protein [Limisphaerales bacterium]